MKNYIRYFNEKGFIKRTFFIFLCFCSTITIIAQTINVKGSVIDTEGNPMIGVTVMALKTKNGTITDFDGNFSIKCEKNEIIEFSFLGYNNIQRKATTNILKITMQEDIKTLDEVVVIGYGTQKKRDITGSISSVSSKTIEERQPVNLLDAIQGAAAGVQITNSSGAPGESGTMMIRGVSTLGSGVNPLFVVDGVPTESIDDINPSDIESMEIIKDAASAAIYGSRSAGGVIIITTKQGKEGVPVDVSVKYNHSIKQLSHKLDQANAFERAVLTKKTFKGLSMFTASNDSLNILNMADNDYQDLITRPAHSDQIDISMSGSKDKVRYYSSLSFLNDNGIVINSYFKRLTSRTNVDFQATKHLKFITRLTLSYINKNNLNTGTIISQSIKRPPQQTLYYPDGSYCYFNGGERNPIAEAYERIDETSQYNMQFYQGIELNILKGLVWNANVQVNYGIKNIDNFMSSNLDSNGTSSGYNRTTQDRKLTAETYLNYTKKILKNHNLNIMLGSNIEDWRNQDYMLKGKYYITDEIITSNMQAQKDVQNTKTYYQDHSMVGIFGRLGYNYKGKYILSSNLRFDGSSRFVNNRWGVFPSASGAWRISDEKFMKWSKKYLTDAKFRISWGMTGNERVGNYDAINKYTTAYYGGNIGVKQNSRIANKDLSWEATEQTNLGLDLTFLDGRIALTADYYIKNTSDLLTVDKMPSELGIEDMRVNFGEIQNKGIEISITSHPIRTKKFDWETSINYTINKNTITEIAGGMSYIEDGKYLIEEGGPVGQWYGYTQLGIYPTDEANAYVVNADGSFGERLTPVYLRDPNNYNNIVYNRDGSPEFSHYITSDGQEYKGKVGQMTTNGQVFKGGDVIWKDKDSDGVIGDKDREVLGEGLPKWYLGWNNNIRYKDWSLSLSFYGSFGNKIYNQLHHDLNKYQSGNWTPFPKDIMQIWKYQGQITERHSGINSTTGVQNGRELSSYYLENGNYIKLSNIRLTYNLNRAFAQKIHAKRLSVYIYGTNILTWSNYTGFDASSISDSNILHPGIDNGRYPTARELGLGFNVSF